MRNNFLVFGSPLIEEDEIQEVVACLRGGWIGTGPRVAQFEHDFAQYKGVPFAAAVNSATAGLHLACVSLGLKPGDEIITSAMTFCATVNAIIHSGATPVLADVHPVTGNIDPEEIERRITPRTRAVLVVHFAGRPCDMDPILELARKHDLFVIEDCAHAVEAEYKGRKTGTMGDCGVFSFYVTKNVVTGEGGMVVSKNEEIMKKVKMLALHGMSLDAWQRYSDKGFKHYQVEAAGFKYNMMDIQAALGIHQLRRIDENHLRRREIWDRYLTAFRDLPIGLPDSFDPGTRHALHLFRIVIEESRAGISRDDFLQEMTHHKIGAGVHYLAIPEHPFYQRTFGWKPEDYPSATALGRSTISIPLSPKLTDEDISDVIEAVTSIIREYASVVQK